MRLPCVRGEGESPASDDVGSVRKSMKCFRGLCKHILFLVN